MRRNNIDKAFIDSSWIEMKGILDEQMPVKGNRRKLFLWFFGIIFLLVTVVTGVYLANQNVNSNQKNPAVANNSKEIAKNSTTIDEANPLIESQEILADKNHQISSSVSANGNVKSKNLFAIQEFDAINNKDNSPADISMLLSDDGSNNSTSVEKIFKFSSENTVDAIANEEKKEHFYIDKLSYKFLKLVNKNLSFSLPPNTNFIEPIKPRESRLELAISTRIYDQTNLNGEGALHYNLKNDDFSILPGIAIGYDHYDASTSDIEIDQNTLIKSNVGFSNYNSAVGGIPTSSVSDPIRLNANRSLYISPQLLIKKRIGGPIFVTVGALSRIYTSNINKTNLEFGTALDSNELDPEREGNNQSADNILVLGQDRRNDYLLGGLSVASGNHLVFNVSYLYQLDKSLSLRPYNNISSAYNNVLERINRSEIRAGISWKF